jgi:hypothetical protein
LPTSSHYWIQFRLWQDVDHFDAIGQHHRKTLALERRKADVPNGRFDMGFF